jgi:hypothetical protein
LTRPVSEDLRGRLGVIAVGVAGGQASAPQVQRPWVKSEAAGRGSLWATGRAMSVAALSPPAALLVLPVAPFVGALGMAGRGLDDKVVAGQKRRITAALVAVRPVGGVAAAFVRAGRVETRGTVALVETAAPAAPGPPAAPDTVVEFRVSAFGLAGEDEVNPDLRAFLSVRCRVLRASDRRELYAGAWSAVGRKRQRFAAWDADGVEGIRGEFDNLIQDVAEQAVMDLFLYCPI